MQPNRGSPTTVVVAVAATAAAVTIAAVYVISRKHGKKKRNTNSPSGGKLENVVWSKSLSKLPTDRPVPVVDGANVLGEGPVWCSRKQELWWIDIHQSGSSFGGFETPQGYKSIILHYRVRFLGYDITPANTLDAMDYVSAERKEHLIGIDPHLEPFFPGFRHIHGKKIMKLREGDAGDGKLVAEGWDVPTRPGSLAVREGAEREADCPLVVAFEDAFSLYNPSTGKRAPAASPGAPDEYKQLSNTRMNDGRCDRQGRFISGGLNLENENQSPDVWKPRGGLYRVECGTGGGVRRILPEETFRCYNTTCFSLDGSVMYLSDSPLCKIWCFDYDVVTGLASNKRVFVDLKDEFPDGAAVDSNGCLWVALFGTGLVHRYSPDARLIQTIKVPGAKKTTCVAFGGRDLDILFITSASVGLSDKERLEQPHAGALFAMRMADIKGVPESYFLG